MIASQRKQIIQEQLMVKHSVTISDLVELLNVSAETVRRDLEDMEQNMLLKRVHGGAVSVKKVYNYEEISMRNEANIELKKQLSEKAIEYVKNGDTIAIDSGSTATIFALALKKRQFNSLSIVTYSSEVFRILSDCQNYKITLVGGDYNHAEKLFYGFLANEAMKKLYYAKAFIFPFALSLEDGAHDFINDVYENQCTLLQHASEVYILADSTKFETKGSLKLCDLKEEYTIITDDNLPDSIYNLYISNKIKVIR